MGKVSRTKGGSKIVQTEIFVNPSNSGPGGPGMFVQGSVAKVKGKDGKTYIVPINEKGKVPEYALYQRFLNVSEGSRDGIKRSVGKDLSKEASKVYIAPKGGFTPEELVGNGWWAHPNESDIKGVDDPSTSFFDVAKGADGEISPMGKIAIIANESERKRIRDVLQKDFTKKELKAAVKNGGIVIKVGNPGKGSGGYYRGRQSGAETPMIVLMPEASEDTIVHEFVHHSRRVDPDRYGAADCPFPTDENDALNLWDAEWSSKYSYGDAVNLEEAATVLEAAGRTKTAEIFPTGYYNYSPGGYHKKSFEDVTKEYRHDRDLIIKGGKKNGPLKGKRAIAKVNDKFDESKISDLKYKGRKTGKQFYAEMKNNGDVSEKPKARKPTAKKSNAASSSSSTPGMALANILSKKKIGKTKSKDKKRVKS